MRLIFPLLLLMLINACSTQTHRHSTVVPNWEQHVQQLQQLDHWLLDGKLGYRDSHDGGSAWLSWQQQKDNFDVKLNGPFGAGATRITGDNRYAELQRAGHDNISAKSPAALTEQLFGWQWPVEQLQSWVLGVPSPISPADYQRHNSDGTLAQLKQSDWQLQFSNYRQIDQWLLPGKIKGQRGDYHFTLVIKHWQPGEAH
ncbi:MAG: lipoprotein insertase outer membrane protein LolB [Porticoccus sp.]